MTRLRSLVGIAFALPAFALPLFAQAPIAALVGTVVDPTGKPVPDAEVRVARCDGRLFRCLDLALRDEWIELARVRTDKKGRFGLQVPHGLALRLEVDAPPFARWMSDACVLGVDQRVQLEPAAAVAGQLIDAESGKGTPGDLRAVRGQDDMSELEVFRGRTDAEGRFRFDRLPSGRVTVRIEPDECKAPAWLGLVLEPGTTAPLECKLERGVDITGTVLDAMTGRPIPGALVGEGWTLQKAARTDRDGRYTLRGSNDAGVAQHVDLCCTAPGYERVSVRNLAPGPSPRRADISLETGVRVVGRIVDITGRPIPNAYVAAITSTATTIPWQATRSDADGAFVCDGFPRRAQGVLHVRCPGRASLTYFLPHPAGDGQIDFGNVRVVAPRLVRGTATDADGHPCAGITVRLRGVNGDAAQLAEAPANWSVLASHVGERQVHTDVHGAFAFGDVAPGEYDVAIDGVSPLPVTVKIVAGQDPEPVQITR